MRISILTAAAVSSILLLAALTKMRQTPETESPTPIGRAKAGPKDPAPTASGPDLATRLAEPPNLTDHQVAAFVAARKHDAASLIAAWDLTGEARWLRQAAERHPDDPRVAIAMLTHLGAGSEEVQPWVDSLLRNDPGNAAGNLYAARAALAADDTGQALIELATMHSATRTDFYTEASLSTLLDAYRHAGHGGVSGQFAANAKLKLPAGEMIALGRDLADVLTVAHLSGDDTGARHLGEAGMAAAAQTVRNDGSGYAMTQLIGISMQRDILRQLDGFDLVPGEPELVIDRLAELDAEVADIRQLVIQGNDLLPTLDEAGFGSYLHLLQREGELSALRWLIARHH